MKKLHAKENKQTCQSFYLLYRKSLMVPKNYEEKRKKISEILFCGDFILKYLAFIVYTFHLFMILHSLKYITKFLLIPLVPDQDCHLKFTLVKNSRPVYHRCCNPQMSDPPANRTWFSVQYDLHSL